MSQIINDGSNLLLTLENGKETRVAKEDVELKKYDDGIFINDGLQSYKFIHANVTDPATGTPDELFDAVDDMLESGSVFDIGGKGVKFTEVQLTAPGVTTSRDVSRVTKGTIQYTIANIDTDVTVRAEGKLEDGADFFNLNVNDVDTTKTTNGNFAFGFDRKVDLIRFRFVSETGGTNATIDVTMKIGN